MKYLYIFTISFGVLMFFSLSFFCMGFWFLFDELIYFLEWELFSLSTSSIIMTFLIDWMSLIFMSLF